MNHRGLAVHTTATNTCLLVCMYSWFAHGVCAYDFIAEYTADCTVPINGNCDADVDECSSSPCQNGATCSESSNNALVSDDAYRCSCVWLCKWEFVRMASSDNSQKNVL